MSSSLSVDSKDSTVNVDHPRSDKISNIDPGSVEQTNLMFSGKKVGSHRSSKALSRSSSWLSPSKTSTIRPWADALASHKGNSSTNFSEFVGISSGILNLRFSSPQIRYMRAT